MVAEQKKEPVEVFVCGPDVCKSGGKHEWGKELVKIDEHSMSIVCEKCGMPRMDYDMWGST